MMTTMMKTIMMAQMVIMNDDDDDDDGDDDIRSLNVQHVNSHLLVAKDCNWVWWPKTKPFHYHKPRN